MRYFPLFLDIRDKPVLLVGGGEVAARKVSLLLDAGAKVTVDTVAQRVRSSIFSIIASTGM